MYINMCVPSYTYTYTYTYTHTHKQWKHCMQGDQLAGEGKNLGNVYMYVCVYIYIYIYIYKHIFVYAFLTYVLHMQTYVPTHTYMYNIHIYIYIHTNSASTACKVISLLGKAGNLEKAISVYAWMTAFGQQANIFHYNSIISACAK
jgi:pentatricopeptide repeat protein